MTTLNYLERGVARLVIATKDVVRLVIATKDVTARY